MRWKTIFMLFVCLLLVTSCIHARKTMPDGLDMTGSLVPVADSEIHFIYDLTTKDDKDHAIFDTIFETIAQAQSFVVIDMFLFNAYWAAEDARPVTQQFTDALLARPDLDIVFITDGLNTAYGAAHHEQLSTLQENGVTVIITERERLPDSNLIYSPLYRIGIKHLGYWGSFPDPIGGEANVPLRTWLDLANTKANHRKILVADVEMNNETTLATIITSANPHDASGAHTNVALLIYGKLGKQVLHSEQAVAQLSGAPFTITPPDMRNSNGQGFVQLLTEEAIRHHLIEDIESLTSGDSIDVGMFYLSDRKIVDALKTAAAKGVHVRLLLDANKDAFNREKPGIPNRQVARELVDIPNIEIRWYPTLGEQFHAKFIIITKGDVKIVNLGSANLTRRNIGNYNLESNVRLLAPHSLTAVVDAHTFFEKVWDIGLDYEEYRDDSRIKYLVYRFQEATGLSSF